MKKANIYGKSRVIYVHSSSRTTAGVWVGTMPFLRLASNDSPAIIGDALQQALSASQIGIPHPTDWVAFGKRFLERAGVKSRATFTRNAKDLIVALDGELLSILPTERAIFAKGRMSDEELAVVLPGDASLAEIGAAVLYSLA